ncbi:serine-rich adhesin for platelets isoform X2 [Episyrphus balteatus]|uniref:serine-rich adhesin for platelets isoform X2 n=1 Tax=Episyrphus balteatus TaxID=286459 RepID=UPI0024859AC6|nr:serine-rich adhesin for platelets isoform X2 [Episyrphus balteatus]
MEVAIPGSNNGSTPFQREVREWQRLDPNTGALLTGRLEADRWINGSLNSYGKVVDSQNVSQPNGTQHSQRKQLEVLQARTSSGSMQVIRAHTVQTTSSRWTATSSSSASSSNSTSPALMTSLNASASTTTGGYFPSRLHANLGLTNETSSAIADYSISNNGSGGLNTITTTTTDDDHLASNLHINHHAKLQQHLFSTAPSLKLSNLMKSTPSITNGTNSSNLSNSGSQNKAILHRSINNNKNNNTNNSPTTETTFNRPQRHQHQFLSSSSRQLQNNDSIATTAAALLQQASSSTSSMSSTCTIAPTISSRQITTTSSGSFCYDSSRYDLPTIMTDTYVGGSSVGGGSSNGRIIDICSRDLDDDVGVVGVDDNNDDRLHSSSSTTLLSSSSSSNRQQNQRETIWQPSSSSSVTLQRGRSISTDDLSTKNVNPDGVGGGNSNGIGGNCDEDYDEPAEWRRVSKIRRSFQFPSTSTAETSRSRPADLPASSVSVSKIREELENGRRLSTAMRNNHLDLVALDNILNGGGGGSATSSPLTARKKTASFLTAESLKEIRGKLKKLSDESLYKDDFVTKLEAERDDSPDKVAPNTTADSTFQYKPRSNGTVHTTNSLESRSVKYKDTSSAEWHLRRKSYGFEKMSPPDDKSMFRFENSTDSGLGRSSDLGNWSPTTDSANSAISRATVITFGEQQQTKQISSSESKVRPMVQRRLRNRTQPQSEAESAEMKRHSIAVDESQYVRENLRKTSAVNLNGFYSKDSSPLNSGFSDDNSRRQKRVEFCKTEVHFAAESGRVNIVETDGKPPPSNNFRRRRRSSSSSSTSSTTSSTTSAANSSLDSNKNNLPVIHFGDERKATFDSLELDEEVIDDKNNVTVSIPINVERNFDSAESRDGDAEHQDEISIRGILKNKPPKPKPYHLGENIESSDALWGVQLKPVAAARGFSGERDQTEEDFKEATVSSKSVAERVRIVEERKEGTGYSTKINLNLSNSPYEWTDTSELPQSNIMNIELHSPLTPTIKKPELIRMQAPVAKPRTSAAVKQSTVHKQIEVQQTHQQVTTKSVNHVAPQQIQAEKEAANENLKIVKEARGARKLRDHELSYFGIKMGSNDTTDTRSTKSRLTTNTTSTTSSKRSLPSRKLPSTTKTEERSSSLSNKWSLPNDKPDLLRHSPILVEPQVITKTAIVAPSIGKQRQRSKSPAYSSDEQTDGIYENIKQPYCRQKDLQRDEMILDEMTKTADQTMKAVSDEAAQKDLRRRSISRRSSKPLETIDEKFSKSVSKTALRAKTTTAHRLVRECSNRPSSASSGESLPTTPIAPRARSRSRDNVEYANVKSKPISRPIKHRSSSGESRRSVTSSTEDITQQPRISKSSIKRSSTKDEPQLVRHHHRPLQSQQRSLRSSTESHDRHKVTPRSSTRDRVESHDPSQSHQHSRSSHRSSHGATKSDVEQHKRSSHSSTVESKSSSTKATNRSRATSDNEKPSKSSTERTSRSKGHSNQSESRPHHRSLGSKTATMSSSGGNNSDTLIQSKNANRSTHSSSLKTATSTTKRSSKDRK